MQSLGQEIVAGIRAAVQPDADEVQVAWLNEQRPEDIADAFARLDKDECVTAMTLLVEELAAAVLVELPTETTRELVSDLPDHLIAWYLDILPMDDALDLQGDLGEERFERLLTMIPDEDAQEIRRLLAYPEGSVGRVMTERYFESKPTTTMYELLDDLRIAPSEKYESINDVYVLDDRRHLLGVFSLRALLRAKPTATAEEVMNEEPKVCHATEPAEESARRMSKYGFYALPVLDERGRMLGIFTGDDAQEILREEETRDMLAVGGVSGPADAYLSLNVFKLFKRRLPWLLFLFVAETGTGAVLRHYGQASSSAIPMSPLIFFIPLLIGAGGNSGSQVTTTITRALALKEITSKDWFLVLRREVTTALMIGAVLGVLGFLRAFLPLPLGWSTGIQMSTVIAMALPSIILWAALVASILPIAARRAGFDPAVMSAPFITTLVDATGLIIYFEIAQAIITNTPA